MQTQLALQIFGRIRLRIGGNRKQKHAQGFGRVEREEMRRVAQQCDPAVRNVLRLVPPINLREVPVHRIHIHEPLFVQAKPRLGPQDAPNGFFDARPRNPAGLHGVAQRLERGIRHWRHQHAIGPRQNRARGGLARRVTRRDAAHVHRVGDDQAPITKLFAQQPGQNLGGEGRRNVRVGLYCGNGKMARHDRADARRNRGAERRQLERLKPLAARADHRQIEMRVRRRISVTRKMLGRGQRAIFLHAAHKLRHEFRHASRVFTERARVDDRIARIVVDVRDGRVNPIHSRGARFESGDFAHRVGVLRSAARGNRHLRRKRCAFVEPHRGPALEIGGDEQRNL